MSTATPGSAPLKARGPVHSWPLFVKENSEQEASPRPTRVISCREELNPVTTGWPRQPELGRVVENAVKVEDLDWPTE